jgi:hypothetical protein
MVERLLALFAGDEVEVDPALRPVGGRFRRRCRPLRRS